MTITVLTNASAGAPALNGFTGSLINVLDFCLVTGLGWTKHYTDTNVAVYKQPSGSNGMYLRVNDNYGTGEGAWLTAYESMTAISTGTGQFPTTAQLTNGVGIWKSAGADATPRPWYFISNGKTFYMFNSCNGTTPVTLGSYSNLIGFGDFKTYKAGDAFNTFLWGDTSTGGSGYMYRAQIIYNEATGGHYIARAHTQIGTSVNNGAITDYRSSGNTSYIGAGIMPYPCPLTGGILISKILIGEPDGLRGAYPGVWSWHHPLGTVGVNSYDTFSGAGDTAGKTFIIFKATNYGSCVIFETSDTWDA